MKLTSKEARDMVESYRGKTLNDKLKDYFDNLLGYSLYDLFPEIKDNL